MDLLQTVFITALFWPNLIFYPFKTLCNAMAEIHSPPVMLSMIIWSTQFKKFGQIKY